MSTIFDGVRDDLFAELEQVTGVPVAGIQSEYLPAPHTRPKLPKLAGVNMTAIYVFALSPGYGQYCSAGPFRVLKVGRTNQEQRFTYHHYNGAVGSTVVGSLLANPLLWRYLGITGTPTLTDLGAWLLANTCRYHLFLPQEYVPQSERIEAYVRGRLGPVLESS